MWDSVARTCSFSYCLLIKFKHSAAKWPNVKRSGTHQFLEHETLFLSEVDLSEVTFDWLLLLDILKLLLTFPIMVSNVFRDA